MKRAGLLRLARKAGQDTSWEQPFAREIQAAFRDSDLELFADCLATGTDVELRGLLSAIGVAPEGVFGARTCARLSESLGELVRRGYPEAPWGRAALGTWRKVDKDKATAFLLEDFDLNRAQNDSLGGVAVDLSLCGPSARGHLERLKAEGGVVGEEADRQLNAMLPSVERVKMLSEAWRTERSWGTLASLYYAFMARRAIGRSITKKEVLATFGKPSRTSGESIWYQPNADAAVSFHFDHGEVTGAHIT